MKMKIFRKRTDLLASTLMLAFSGPSSSCVPNNKQPWQATSRPVAASAPAVGGTPTLHLQRPHYTKTPQEVFLGLSEACRAHNIDGWDIYGDIDKTGGQESFLRGFEALVAQELGFEEAVFMPSGVMAQSIALLIHATDGNRIVTGRQQAGTEIDPSQVVYAPSPESINLWNRRDATRCFACHESSHLLLHEEEGYWELLGMTALVLSTSSSSYSISEAAHNNVNDGSLQDNSHRSPTSVLPCLARSPPLDFETVDRELNRHFQDNPDSPVSTLLLEIPHRELGGKVTEWSDILKMKGYCQDRGIRFHCDGARIFEASAYYRENDDVSIRQLAEQFDSMYVSFYKGLGGMSGAMLLGRAEFCRKARTWLRRFGGNLYILLPYALSGYLGFRRHWLLLPEEEKKVEAEHEEAPDRLSDSSKDWANQQKSMMSFAEKKAKMMEIVEALSSHPVVSKVVAFDPATPQTNMVHGYLWESDPMRCQRALETVEHRCGIRVLNRVRSTVVNDDSINNNNAYGNAVSLHSQQPHKLAARSMGYRSFFEWSIGESNGRIPTSKFVEGWSEFALELQKLRRQADGGT
jgi:threonine aldolase